MTRDRVLVWDGCVNVRDLGGLPLEGGGETQYDVVVRADSLAGLTDHGWTELVKYGVTKAVDLRGEDELDESACPIPVVRVPIKPTEWPSMREAYLTQLAASRAKFVRATEILAGAEHPVVVHCAGGRDRTGLLVALVLDAAGVPREAIAADHALSDESFAPYNEAWFAAAATEEERERRMRVAVPAGQTMVEVLEEVDRVYGGSACYLDTAILDMLVLRLRP